MPEMFPLWVNSKEERPAGEIESAGVGWEAHKEPGGSCREATPYGKWGLRAGGS